MLRGLVTGGVHLLSLFACGFSLPLLPFVASPLPLTPSSPPHPST